MKLMKQGALNVGNYLILKKNKRKDAATDILGRNYSEGKTFLKVLEELQAGAGTRYNPTLVKLIQEDEDLIGRLSDLTREGRYEVYRQVFEEINP